MGGRKPKKVTQKDRYGNQVSYEYAPEIEPLKITDLYRAILDKEIPETLFELPQEAGGISFGLAQDHPGEPQGSDTVPAWLTPGEFVMNKEGKEIMDREVPGMLEQFNDRGRAVQQRGGGDVPYMYQEGGDVGGDQRNFFQRLALLAGLEGTPPQIEPPTPLPVEPDEHVYEGSLPKSPTQTLIEAREGYNPEVYEDTRGFNTVGFGHRTDEPLGSVPYTRQQNEANLGTDIETAERHAKAYAGAKWNDLNKQQRAALTSMALQLGGAGQREFENMQEALHAGDWAGVRREARDSLWADQTPARVEDIEAAFMAEGGWVSSLWDKVTGNNVNPRLTPGWAGGRDYWDELNKGNHWPKRNPGKTPEERLMIEAIRNVKPYRQEKYKADGGLIHPDAHADAKQHEDHLIPQYFQYGSYGEFVMMLVISLVLKS